MPNTPRHRLVLGALVAGILVISACSSSGDTAKSSTTSSRSPATLAKIPPEVAANAESWPLPGRDYGNSRARTDATITSANVDRLDVAWSVPLPGASAYGNAATVPLVVDGTVYVQDLTSNVRAIDLETGAVKWTKVYSNPQIGPNGVAVGYGRVYCVKSSTEIAALDLATGDEVWSTKITATATDGVDIQPTVFDGLVFAATVPVSIKGQFAGSDRGVLWALDANTGAKVWTFDTVDSPDVWGNPQLNSGGGAWYPPAIDVDAGVVYWGTANPAPFPGTPEFPNGSSRPGPNLYTNSVLAIDARTGALRWFDQAHPHDLFDRDLVHTAVTDVTIDGERQRIVAVTGKGGRVYVLSPDGKRRSETLIGKHLNDDLTELTGPTEVFPGLFGGVETPPAVADGVMYAATLNAGNVHAPDVQNYLGGAKLGQMPGDLAAVDLATGAVKWSTPVNGDPLGGATVVGDLVFSATYQGDIVAVKRDTGAIVRTFPAPGGVNGWPAVTEDTILWPIGISETPRLVAYRVK